MIELTLSHKWANKIIMCNVEGIKKYCGGCCIGAYFPSDSNNKRCSYLDDNIGCIAPVKGLKCKLYPFTIKNNKLVLHGRALIHSCKLSYKQGNKTILEHSKENFISLFGEFNYNNMVEFCKLNKDYSFFVSDELMELNNLEIEYSKQNIRLNESILNKTKQLLTLNLKKINESSNL